MLSPDKLTPTEQPGNDDPAHGTFGIYINKTLIKKFRAVRNRRIDVNGGTLTVPEDLTTAVRLGFENWLDAVITASDVDVDTEDE